MPIHLSHIYNTQKVLVLLGIGVFLTMCTPFPNRRDVDGDMFWTRDELYITLSFIDPNNQSVIGGKIDTSMYQIWYILSINDSNKVDENC
jgi:hypothetical protein